MAMKVLKKLKKLFGQDKYPFDKEKAYHYPREGVMAGGGFHLEFSPEGVVDYYSYVKPVPEYEGGMRDKGADIYFVGLKKGQVKVTAVFEYPTCPPDEYTFTLNVDKNLHITKTN